MVIIENKPELKRGENIIEGNILVIGDTFFTIRFYDVERVLQLLN